MWRIRRKSHNIVWMYSRIWFVIEKFFQVENWFLEMNMRIWLQTQYTSRKCTFILDIVHLLFAFWWSFFMLRTSHFLSKRLFRHRNSFFSSTFTVDRKANNIEMNVTMFVCVSKDSFMFPYSCHLVIIYDRPFT